VALQTAIYSTAMLALVGVVLLVAVLRAINTQTSPTGAGSYIDGRLSGIDRGNETLRRAITEMDIGLRDVIASGTREGLDSAFEKVQEGAKSQAEGLTSVQQALNQLADTVRTGIEGFSQRLGQEQEQLRSKVDAKLDEIRTGNEAKLEQMREAVDQKLQSALEKRLETSFQHITEQFGQVQQAIGQVLSVTGEIGDLKRLFSNVKVRGGIAEAHLQVVLDDFLPPGAYEANYRVSDSSGEAVEFAVRMPQRGAGGDVWLAIDAKFPIEDYTRLVAAREAGDRDLEAAALKALERRIRDEARRIAGKYIKPPQTTDFAIMYLPTESLDSEVYRIPGLIENLRRQHQVHVVGPRLLPAYLHSVRVGYLTFALEQKAGAIGEILAAVKAEWARLGESMDALARRAETLSNGIRDTQRRTRVVGRTLRTVEAMELSRAEEVLRLSGDTAIIDGEVEDGFGRTEPASRSLAADG
jgi:DNA recombination protein RmuC